ncbi:MAG TPA: ATP-binding protein [Gemmatimonadaceae bacterium]|nr:ATP-binding protein [Gemmatimonadaceae bacterium]
MVRTLPWLYEPLTPTATSIHQRDDLDRRLLVQNAVSRALAESETVEDALPRVLSAVGTQLDWQFGAFWLLDDERQLLRCAAVWRSRDYPEFDAATRAHTFARGRGIPGLVWQTGEAVSIKDASDVDRLPRQEIARREGLHSVFAFPVFGFPHRDEDSEEKSSNAPRRLVVTGVVELYSEQFEAPDEQLLQTATSLGFQLGVFLESRRALDAELAQRVRNAAVVEIALDCVITIDHDGRILEWNPAAERTFGHSRGAVLGRQLAETIIPPHLRDAHCRGFARFRQTGEGSLLGKRVEVEGMRADGSFFPCELAITRVPIPGTPVFTAYLRDLTGRVRMEATQQLLLRASNVLISSVDSERMLCELSRVVVPTFADWYAVDVVEEDQTIRRVETMHRDPGKTGDARVLADRYANRPESQYGVRAVIRSGRSELVTEVTEEMLADMTPDDEHRRLVRALGLRSFIVVPLRGRERIFGALSFVTAESGRRFDQHDLEVAEELAIRAAQAIDNSRLFAEAEESRRLLAEQATQLQEANRAKSQFLAAMSHELRTPLNAIMGYAQLLDVGIHGSVNAEQQADLGRIQRSSQHLLGLINDILNYAKVESGRLEYDIKSIRLDQAVASVEELVAPLAAAKRITYSVRSDCPGASASADPEKLRQILVNLLSNAFSYTLDGGSVDVCCSTLDTNVLIEVRDTGVGIPADKLEAIFEPFVQVDRAYAGQRQGTGLGLAISRDLARGMGGELTVRSEPGKGSVFTVRLAKA